MGYRPRPDSAAAGSEPPAIGDGHRDGAGQLRASGALDCGARDEFLESASVGMINPSSTVCAPEPQIRRAAAFALGFAAIARHGVIWPRIVPVGGAFCEPKEIRRSRQMR